MRWGRTRKFFLLIIIRSFIIYNYYNIFIFRYIIQMALDNVFLWIIWVVFFRVPALKIFRAAHRPLEKWQTVDCRLPVHSLSAADPCGHGTDRHKRTEHYHEYTHHFSKGLKLPMGTMVKPSSFTFRLLKSNSSSKELPKLSSTTTIKLCASSPSAV